MYAASKAQLTFSQPARKDDLWHHTSEVEHENCGGKAKWSGIQHGHVVSCLKCGFSQYLALLKDYDKIPGWWRRIPVNGVASVSYDKDPVDGWTTIAKAKKDQPKVCECGATKVGVKPYAIGHSSYCPVKAT